MSENSFLCFKPSKQNLETIQNENGDNSSKKLTSLRQDKEERTELKAPSLSRWDRWTGIFLAQMICVPFIKRPFQNLKVPSAYGVQDACAIKIPCPNNEYIGAWFMLATSKDPDDPERFITGGVKFAKNDRLVLYLHGNSDTRSNYYRIKLYKKLQSFGFHVLAIDYRGYGDSSRLFPNENTMMTDGFTAIKFLKERSNASTKLILWGHSLGTGVCSKLMSHIVNDQLVPSHLILESPFNNMYDQIMTMKIYAPVAFMVDFHDWLRDAECEFKSDVWIKFINRPVLILHSRNDSMVPYKLGKQLFDDAKEGGCQVYFRSFDDLEHDGIYRSGRLKEVVTNFIK